MSDIFIDKQVGLLFESIQKLLDACNDDFREQEKRPFKERSVRFENELTGRIEAYQTCIDMFNYLQTAAMNPIY